MTLRFSSRVVFCSCLAVLLGSCEWLADIPDRTLITEPCERFCTLAMELCTGDYAIYDDADCQTTCQRVYNPDDLACREAELKKLQNSGTHESDLYCANASLSGGTTCNGKDHGPCKSYCNAMGTICADHPEPNVTYPKSEGDDSADCEQKCSVIPVRTANLSGESTYSVSRDHSGDTLQCRLVHLTLASESQEFADEHCWHAYIRPYPKALVASQPDKLSASPCSAPMGAIEIQQACEDYCHVVTAACTDDGDKKHAVYESEGQCVQACKVALPAGSFADDSNNNSVACRTFHAYNAAVFGTPETHCPHAGPGGAGTCGDDCEGYCSLFKAGCPDQFQSQHDGSMDACRKACDSARKANPNNDNGKTYSVAKAETGDPTACRLYYTVRAAAQGNDAQDACMIAAGIEDCPFPQKK